MNEHRFTILTRSETRIMEILWQEAGGASVSDVLEHFEEPHPAYTTIATFLNILCRKGFAGRRKKGFRKTYVYYARVSRDEYIRKTMIGVKESLFSGSAANIVHYFLQTEELTIADVERLIKLIEQNSTNR